MLAFGLTKMDKNSINELAMTRRTILALSTHEFKKLCNFEHPYCSSVPWEEQKLATPGPKMVTGQTGAKVIINGMEWEWERAEIQQNKNKTSTKGL